MSADEPPEGFLAEIDERGKLYAARRRAREWIRRLGFPEPDASEVDLVVSELTGNLLEHARGGHLRMEPVSRGAREGVRIEAMDDGPGIPDPDRAVVDGFTTGGSLGYGLGTVHRLMDEVELSAVGEAGARIACFRWLRKRDPFALRHSLSFGVVSRSHPGFDENGDSFVVRSWGDQVLVGVIDGLGHGRFAQRAAQTARRYVERHHEQPLEQLFQGTNRACRGTRGVVMALARFDCALGRLAVASVGNIEVRLLGSERSLGLLVRRGVVGLNAPSVPVAEGPWEQDYTLVLHSDGLRSTWKSRDFAGLAGQSASHVAAGLFHELSDRRDDATILVVKGRSPDAES